MNIGVHFIRFVSGEAVIANVTETTDVYVAMENPAQLTAQQDPAGNVQLGLVDFLPFAEKGHKKITVDWMHILYTHEPTSKMLNVYNEQYGSGIVLATGLPPKLRPV